MRRSRVKAGAVTYVATLVTILVALACGQLSEAPTGPDAGGLEPKGLAPSLGIRPAAFQMDGDWLEIDDPCGVTIVPAGQDDMPGEIAAPGTKKVRLVSVVGDTLATDPTPLVKECAADGIGIAAKGVTLDLNGISLQGPGAGHGVTVTAANVKINNLNGAGLRSVVEDFDVNFGIENATGVKLLGTKVGSPLAANIVGGDAVGTSFEAHGAGGFTVRTVDLVNTLGGHGAVIVGCSAAGNSITAGRLRGSVSALQVENCIGLAVTNNKITSANAGDGIRIEILGGTNSITGNVIEDNLFDAVNVGPGVSDVTITGNRIRRNAACGIRVSPFTSGITTEPNTFAKNGPPPAYGVNTC